MAWRGNKYCELRKDWGVNMVKLESDKISISKKYTQVNTYEEYDVKNVPWHEGMVSGNGHIGVIESCVPVEDTLIYQNVEFVMPSGDPRHVPEEVTGQLDEARQAVLHMDDTWDIHGRKRTNMYCYHPGHQLRVTMPDVKETADYVRYTDMINDTINTTFTADGRQITRQTCVLGDMDVVVTKIVSDIIPDTFINIDDFEGMPKFGKEKNGPAPEQHMKYSRFAKNGYIGVIAHYPVYEGSELMNGGFAAVTQVFTDCGNIEIIRQPKNESAYSCMDESEPVIKITGAGKIYLITCLDWTDNLGNMEAFQENISDYHSCDIVQQCIDKINNNTSDIFNKIDEKSVLTKDSYSELKTNEELLEQQKSSEDIIPQLLWRLYNNGIYGMRACAGQTAPRLSGMWTGEWNLSWRSAYTMDANVNIQVSGMNSTGIYDAGVGYMWFILRQIPDWEINAQKVYGVKDAVLIPVNTDGHRAMMVEYDINYPFQYWNAGAAWMLIPIYEFLQTYGDRTITTNDKHLIDMYGKNTFDVRKDIFNILLCKTYNFWKQICDAKYYTDIDGNARYDSEKCQLDKGEKYLIIPAFSPENKPLGYKSAITANTAMDISAAKDVINMYVGMLKGMTGEEDIKNNPEEKISEAQKLLETLPDFAFDESGALREWSMKEYKENNEHRHISHLYCAWPALQTQNDQKLAAACRQAILNRNRENQGKDDTASHGWIHKALVEARLKNADEVYDILKLLVHSDIFYTTLFTDHNTDRSKGVYCTDTAFGLVGVMNEMLMYSDETTIELLPAYSPGLGNGSVSGLMSRCGIRIDKLEWNYDKMSMKAELYALRDVDVKIICRQFDIEKMCHMKAGDNIILLQDGKPQ